MQYVVVFDAMGWRPRAPGGGTPVSDHPSASGTVGRDQSR
jgi:hypothetical protein